MGSCLNNPSGSIILDWSKRIDVSATPYVVPADGLFVYSSNAGGCKISINGVDMAYNGRRANYWEGSCQAQIPVRKGDNVNFNAAGYRYFIPFK